LKIVYISNSIIPSRTANSIHVMKMCQAFADNGHEVILLAPDRYKEYENNVDNVYSYYGVKENFRIKKLKYNYLRGISGLFYGFSTYLLVQKYNPDLVYGRFASAICILSLKYKAVLELHSPTLGLSKVDSLFFKLFKNKLSKIVLISEALKKIYIKEKIIYDENKYIVAHDGADKVENLKDKVKLYGDSDKLKVGYVGHLYKGRGIELIINCAEQLNNFTFHIVGGNQNDISYWKGYLLDKNIQNVYLYGYVNPSQTVLYRNSFDIVMAPYSNNVSISKSTLNTSTYMSPLKIFEYMSHKKPIITSDLPVLREVLNEENSILVDYDNEKEWINAIKKLKNYEFSSMIANNAFIKFSKKYTWINRVNKILKEVK